MEKEFEKIRAISLEYSQKFKEWEERHLKSSFGDAMKAQIQLFEEFDKKLGELELHTPQAQYALCKIRGSLTEYNRGSHDYMMRQTDPLTYEEFLRKRIPDPNKYEAAKLSRLRFIDISVDSDIARAKHLTDQQAEHKLNNECFQSAARYPQSDASMDEIFSSAPVCRRASSPSRYS